MFIRNYRPDWTQTLLLVLLFVLGHTSSYAINTLNESSLTLFDQAPKQVIYLAQSSSGEEPVKKIVEEEEEEEEEEPECD
jgi:hypothetical protein